MKIFEAATRKVKKAVENIGKTASDGAIDNVKRLAIDAMPVVMALGSFAIALAMCKSTEHSNSQWGLPDVQTMHVTINNYYNHQEG